MLVICDTSMAVSTAHSRPTGGGSSSGENGKARTRIKKLQGLPHAIARGLVPKHHAVHDAGVWKRYMVVKGASPVVRERRRRTWDSGIRADWVDVGELGKRDLVAQGASLARFP